jgi:hypothetical protein
MSSEATDLTVATLKRDNPAPYWTFFTTEDFAFWNFVDRSREGLKTQQAPPPQKAQGAYEPPSNRRPG